VGAAGSPPDGAGNVSPDDTKGETKAPGAEAAAGGEEGGAEGAGGGAVVGKEVFTGGAEWYRHDGRTDNALARSASPVRE